MAEIGEFRSSLIVSRSQTRVWLSRLVSWHVGPISSIFNLMKNLRRGWAGVNFMQLWFWQSFLRPPTNNYLPSVAFVHVALLQIYNAICTTQLVVKNVHLFVSLTSCLFVSDTDGDWEWAQWGHCYRLVPTGGTTGTQATHTEGNSEELLSWYWAM